MDLVKNGAISTPLEFSEMLLTSNIGPISTTKALGPHFLELAYRAAYGRLTVITGSHRINAVAPDVGSQFGEGKTGIKGYDPLAQIGAWLALASRAVIEVVDIDPERGSELFALRRLGYKEVGSEVHMATNQVDRLAMIEQKDLQRETFCTFIKMIEASTFET